MLKKMMKVLLASLFAFSIAWTSFVFAKDAQRFDIGITQQNLKKVTALRTLIVGMGTGLMLANSELIKRKTLPFFCPPQEIELTADRYLHLFETKLVEYSKTPPPEIEKYTEERVMLDALVDKYPCETKVQAGEDPSRHIADGD